MKGDPITFMQAANVVLNTTRRITDDNFMVEDDLHILKTSNNEKGRSSYSLYPKPLRPP